MNEPYKMILVDDEDEVRGRINSKISSDSGFSVVGTAGNGYDAIELIEKLSPHVVLTDIKMPYIDGIELATIIKRDFPTVRVAFITGYDEFSYAREAVELHISSYLTKPVTQDDISNFLHKLKIELDNEFQEKYNIEALRKRYEQSIPLIIDNYFNSFLITALAGNASDIENLKEYGISLDDTRYLLSFVQLERDENLRDVIEYEKLKLSVRSIIQTILERYAFDYYSFMFHDGIVFLIKEGGLNFLKRVDQAFYEMVKMAEKFLSAKIDIGVSELHREFRTLRNAYQEAEKALGYSKFLNTGRIVYINQLEGKKPKVLNLSEAEVQTLEYAAKFGSEDEIRRVVSDLREAALQHNHALANYRLYIINLVNIVVNFAESVKVDLQEILGEDLLEKIAGFRNLEQLFDWVLSVLLQLRALNVTTKMTNSQRLLDSAVTFITAHYRDPNLSMEQVCDELGISISYISLLFKKHKSTTFVKYLTRVRMEKAQELLNFTGDRVVEIAHQCGYRDVYYFSHSFKKYKGVSPKNYRDKSNA